MSVSVQTRKEYSKSLISISSYFPIALALEVKLQYIQYPEIVRHEILLDDSTRSGRSMMADGESVPF